MAQSSGRQSRPDYIASERDQTHSPERAALPRSLAAAAGQSPSAVLPGCYPFGRQTGAGTGAAGSAPDVGPIPESNRARPSANLPSPLMHAVLDRPWLHTRLPCVDIANGGASSIVFAVFVGLSRLDKREGCEADVTFRMKGAVQDQDGAAAGVRTAVPLVHQRSAPLTWYFNVFSLVFLPATGPNVLSIDCAARSRPSSVIHRICKHSQRCTGDYSGLSADANSMFPALPQSICLAMHTPSRMRGEAAANRSFPVTSQ